MKRKKWSEVEEETLLTKYFELLNLGTLSKLKTREKKFKPVAEHVNSIHHLQDPTNFPFKWSWRDVSIKIQNMRHQYLGVKQKIRVSKDEFSWKDGENHWVNFLKYKDVFGDVELETKEKRLGDGNFDHDDVLGLGFGEHDDDDDDRDYEGDEIDDELEGNCATNDQFGDTNFVRGKKSKKGFGSGKLGSVGAQVLELRDVMLNREERIRERDFDREIFLLERENAERELEDKKEKWQKKREEECENKEIELEERQIIWERNEYEKRTRLEMEFDKERRWRMMMEEKKEKEEREWREKIISLQMEHEKAMVQMHAEACQNQMQLIGVMTRFVCQIFGSVNDGLSTGLGHLPNQILHHSRDLGDNGKPDANSPSEFL